MNNQIEINSFDDLIEVFEQYDLTETEINEVLITCFGVVSIFPFPKTAFLARLRNFYEKWGSTIDKPLFVETEAEIHALMAQQKDKQVITAPGGVIQVTDRKIQVNAGADCWGGNISEN